MEEMVIAVGPDEVELLTKALHSGARVDCVPRSGRPVEESASMSPSAPRRSQINVIESISGSNRRAISVPSGPGLASPLPMEVLTPMGDQNVGEGEEP